MIDKQGAFWSFRIKENFMEKVAFDLRMKKWKDNGGKWLKRRESEQRWKITGCISQNIFQKIFFGGEELMPKSNNTIWDFYCAIIVAYYYNYFVIKQSCESVGSVKLYM